MTELERRIVKMELFALQKKLTDKNGVGRWLSGYGRWWLPLTRKRLEVRIKRLEERLKEDEEERNNTM